MFVKNPDLLDSVFEEYDLSAAELAGIRKVFTTNTPNVIHNYPHGDSKFPLFAITLSSENTDTRYIGESAGEVMGEDDPDLHSDVLGSIWSHSFGIMVYTDHPDVTLYYYEIAKTILLANWPFFIDKGFMDLSLGGADIMPDAKYIPEWLFVRKLQIDCKDEFARVDRDSKLHKAFRLSGIYVDNPDTVGDVTGVVAKIKVITE
jgi:hypothetical protein